MVKLIGSEDYTPTGRRNLDGGPEKGALYKDYKNRKSQLGAMGDTK